jgi:hypothetical protein
MPIVFSGSNMIIGGRSENFSASHLQRSGHKILVHESLTSSCSFVLDFVAEPSKCSRSGCPFVLLIEEHRLILHCSLWILLASATSGGEAILAGTSHGGSNSSMSPEVDALSASWQAQWLLRLIRLMFRKRSYSWWLRLLQHGLPLFPPSLRKSGNLNHLLDFDIDTTTLLDS